MDANQIVDNRSRVVNVDQRFRLLQHATQATYLLQEDLHLLCVNVRGLKAIDHHWVGLKADKIDFNSPRNNEFVRALINELITNQQPNSRMFVLQCVDSIPRTYTLTHDPDSYASGSKCELVLTIRGDLVSDENKISAVSDGFSLSACETNILNWMVKGLKPKEIAYEESISLCTVRSHLRTLYAKMNVRSYNDALILAVRLMS